MAHWLQCFFVALQKNVLLRRHAWFSTLLEVSMPAIFMLLLSIGYWLASDDTSPAEDYVAKYDMLSINATWGVYDSYLFCNPWGMPNLPAELLICDPNITNMTAAYGFPLGANSSIVSSWVVVPNVTYAAIFVAFLANASIPFVIPDLDSYLILQAFESRFFSFNFPLEKSPKASLSHPGFLALVSDDESLTESFMHYCGNHSTLCLFYIFPQVFGTLDDARNYAYLNGNTFWAILDLSQLSLEMIQSPGGEGTAHDDVLPYGISMNYTATPWTFQTVLPFTTGLGRQEYLLYLASGFLTLQQFVNGFIIDTAAEASNTSQLNDTRFSTTIDPAQVVVAPMPTRAYFTSQFLLESGMFIPLVMTFAMLYGLSRVLSGIVEEKEGKVREALLIMGLPLSAFYSSWLVTSMMINLIACIGSSIVLKLTLFNSVNLVMMIVVNYCFALTIIAVSMLLSVFFSKPRIAAIFGPLLMFVSAVPYYAIPVGTATKYIVFASVLPCTAYAQAINIFISYAQNGYGVHWNNFFDGDYSIALSVVMMLFDTVVYLMLAMYLDLVLPSEYGTRRHPLFFLQCCCRCTRPRSDGHHEGGASSTTTSMATLRAEKNDTKDASLVDDLHERFVMHTPLVVDVQHLVKTYDTEGSSEPIRAVRDISFRLHQGCIHVLLGHNGAGKSTTINMLVGLVPPTSGDVSICGMSIATSLSTIRKNLGYCPQHNIIWPSLTVTQHLRVYARIKSSSWNVDDMVESTLELVQLKEKRNAAAGSLSGGQKRKLCVGISLIGNSPFLLLDEPTAGMDLEARRAMWELLQKIRKTRCVLLSTHFMDEADLLGDRVIIMSHGNIHSAGSPLFLKSRLGIGYSVTCVLEHERSSDALIHALQERYHQERSARGMDVDGSSTQASSRILDVTKRGKEVVVRFPMTFTSVAGGVFEMLENRKQELQVATFGLSLTTMEDVFLSIALLSGDVEQVVDGDTRFEQRVHGTARTAVAAPPPRDAVGAILSEQEPLLNSSKKQDDHQGLPRRDVDDASTPTKNIGISAAVSHKQRQTFRTHFYALLCKRIHCAKRDRRMLCFQVVMPVAFLIIALLILLLHPPDQPPLVLNGSMYTERTDVLVSPAPELFTASGPGSIEALSAVDHAMYNIQTQSQCNNAYNNSMCLSQKLLQEYNTHTTPRYVAVAPYSNVEYRPPNGDVTWINATWSTILQNATAVHSAPEGLSYFSNLVFRSLQNRPTATIQVTNYPLTLSQAQQVLISSIRRIVSAIFILIPFTFIPANYVCFIVKEKECKAKHLQWVAGANMLSFWLSSMLWDMITYLCTEFLCIAVFFIFKRDEFVGDGPTFAATFLLFFMYGLASIPFSYVISFCFRNSSSAQNITMMGNFFAGFLLVMAAQILAAIPTTQETNRYLCKFYRVVPAYALGEGIITLTGRELAQLVMGRSIAPPFELLDYDNGNGGFFGGVGTSLIYLGITAPFFFGMLLVIELTRSWLLRSQLNIVKPQPNEADLEDYGHEDPDVMTERLAAESNTPTTSCVDDDGERKVIHGRSGDGVTVQHLRKVYPGNKLAVKHLSFGVKSGETFALLGTNGAGKTTTIATLTGEHTPTCGDAFINGSSIVKNMHEARQWIGYCPQFDALLEHMTPREHLVLYCRLRGLAPQETQAEVDRILTALCLEDYADTMAKSLSGGNKRKLSLAIALIGDTKCILLDEPTAGMDPVARRDLWKSLALVSEHRSIVLTTHHLEEVEALADRVGIMVRGKMMCLGTLQQLKSKFVGDVFELQLSFASPERREQEQDANRATVTMIHTVQQQQQQPHVVVSTNKEATQHTNIHATEEEHQNALAMVHYLKAALAPEAVVDIAEVQGNKCVLCVEKAPLSQLFRLVEQRKVQLEDDFHKERSSVKVNGEAAASVVRRITEYSLSQATLEQVFLRIGVLARQEEEEEGGGGSH